MSKLVLHCRFYAAMLLLSMAASPILAQPPIPARIVRLVSDRKQPVIVTAIASDPTGQTMAVAGDDHQIRIVSVATLRTLHTLRGHRDRIRTVTFDPKGERLVSAGNDGQVMIWDCTDGYGVRQRLEGTPALARVRFAPSGSEMAAVGFDNEVYVMGRRAGSVGNPVRATMLCDCRDLRAVAYSDDERQLAIAGRSGDLHLFDLQSGKLSGEYAVHAGRINDLVFAPDSDLAISVGEDGRIVSFDTKRQTVVHRTKITSGKLFALAMLDSRLAAVAGSDNVIRVVNVDNGSVLHSLQGHMGSVPALAAADGYLISGGFDATLRRWAIADLQPEQDRIAEKNNGEKRE
jgi:WD40 repeat protein